jgi:hypothetical protein
MFASQLLGLPVSEWESWNEPNSAPVTDQPGFTTMQKAQNYVDAWYWASESALALGLSNTIVAGTFSNFSATGAGSPTGFGTDYINIMGSDGFLAAAPVWSYHAYDDVINSYGCTSLGASGCKTTETANLVLALAVEYAGLSVPAVWITEAGHTMDNVTTHLPNTHIDGQPTGQANAAEGAINLTTAFPGLVTRLYWDTFETHAATNQFDASLVAADGASVPYGGSGGNRAFASIFRPSFCVLAYNYAPATAAGAAACNDNTNPDGEDTDWEDSPTG